MTETIATCCQCGTLENLFYGLVDEGKPGFICQKCLMLNNNQGFYEFNTVTNTPVVSDLELRIRKEVMAAVDELLTFEEKDEEYFYGLLRTIKDRLNLLWGE